MAHSEEDDDDDDDDDDDEDTEKQLLNAFFNLAAAIEIEISKLFVLFCLLVAVVVKLEIQISTLILILSFVLAARLQY